MEIYTLITEEMWAGNQDSPIVETFTDRKEAEKRFAALKRKAKKTYKSWDLGDGCISDTPVFYEISDTNGGLYNHVNVSLIEGNTKKKVYLLMQDWVVDCDPADSPSIEIYDNKQVALEKFSQAIKDAKTDILSWISEEDVEEDTLLDNDGLGLYSVALKEEWNTHHIEVQLIEKEI